MRASPVMSQLSGFHDFLLVIVTVITVFILALLIYIILRFNAKANPVSSKTTHNTSPGSALDGDPHSHSRRHGDSVPSGSCTTWTRWRMPRSRSRRSGINGIGPTSIRITTTSPSMPSCSEADELEEGQPRLLATDTAVVVPVNKTVRVLVTSTDVLHAWAIPAFGAKIDAVPGRLNETWFRAEKEGHLLRTVFGTLRYEPRHDADHGQGRLGRSLCGVAERGERGIRNQG